MTLAKANADGQAVRAAGDAESSAIYAKAYDKDPSFYAKYRSFEVYKKIFTDKDTLMVLSPDDKFMKYYGLEVLVPIDYNFFIFNIYIRYNIWHEWN